MALVLKKAFGILSGHNESVVPENDVNGIRGRTLSFIYFVHKKSYVPS